jgi:hypothetical protein
VGSSCRTCNHENAYEDDIVNIPRNQVIVGLELKERVIETLLISQIENELFYFFKVNGDAMGIKQRCALSYFAYDRIELVSELLDLNNEKDVMAHSYHVCDVTEFQTIKNIYFSIPQMEYLVMLQVGAIWLVNQYRRDLIFATVNEGAFINVHEQVIININTEKNISTDLWLGDSGASCHMTCSEEGMYNCRDIKSPLRLVTGEHSTK